MIPTIKIYFERWKWNSEHELWVSTEGRVKDRYKQDVQININQKGYERVYSEPEKCGISVHRLVLETWRPREDSNTLTVEHRDSNKRHNSLKNLMWMTRAENLRRAQEKEIVEPLIAPSSSSYEKMIKANGVTMTVKDAATFIYCLPGIPSQYSKVGVAEKIKETLRSKKIKKTIFGVTLEEI